MGITIKVMPQQVRGPTYEFLVEVSISQMQLAADGGGQQMIDAIARELYQAFVRARPGSK